MVRKPAADAVPSLRTGLLFPGHLSKQLTSAYLPWGLQYRLCEHGLLTKQLTSLSSLYARKP